MTTRTDFYLGRGARAAWLGSLQFACHPDNLLKLPQGRDVLTATGEAAYRVTLTELLFRWPIEGLGAAHRAHNGWPWRSPTSHSGDWIITYDDGVFMTAGGGPRWHRLDSADPRPPLACGPPNFAAWLRDPAAFPAVPLPDMHDPATRQPVHTGGTR